MIKILLSCVLILASPAWSNVLGYPLGVTYSKIKALSQKVGIPLPHLEKEKGKVTVAASDQVTAFGFKGEVSVAFGKNGKSNRIMFTCMDQTKEAFEVLDSTLRSELGEGIALGADKVGEYWRSESATTQVMFLPSGVMGIVIR